MTSVRIRTCVAGSAVAVLAGALVTHGERLGSAFFDIALLGLLLGAVVGLVPHRSGLERLGGFAVGFLAAWIGYALRAGVLPDIPVGKGLAAVVVVSLVTAVAVASRDRLPLWSGLLGAGALVGAYETTYLASPPDFIAESTAVATALLLAAAFGYAVTNILGALAPVTVPAPQDPASIESTETDEIDPSSTPVPGPRVTHDVPTSSETNR
jgi:hypothetical protein